MATFVGIGFGPIQAGLFLYEAAQSGAFDRLVASEILADKVQAVTSAGRYALNIAHADHVKSVEIESVTLYDPNDPESFDLLVEAIAEASAIATALPSVATFTASRGLDAPDRLIAAGLHRKREINGPPAILYTAENNNHAAELLKSAVRAWLPEEEVETVLAPVAFVNTVISKMSGYGDPAVCKQPLAYIAPGYDKAFLVEAFDDILISRISFPSADVQERFVPGITHFREKADLLPFEEAKLYCHNGMHAFGAYLGKIAGCTSMAQLRHVPGILPLVRAAAYEEPGLALAARYRGIDSLFTPEGMAHFIDDYLERMVNPFLDDEITRVARDPARKLGWDDRLIGAMRLAMQEGIQPRRYALGAAAALSALVEETQGTAEGFPRGMLPQLWQRPQEESAEVERIETLIAGAWEYLKAFRGASSATPVAPAHGATASDSTGHPSTAAGAGGMIKGALDEGVSGEEALSDGKSDALPTSTGSKTANKWGEGTPVQYERNEETP